MPRAGASRRPAPASDDRQRQRLLRMSGKLSGSARRLGLAILLSLAAAHAQNAVPATNASRRDRLTAAAEQLQPDPGLQPVDASSGALLDRGVRSNLLDLAGDASQPGIPDAAADPQLPVAWMRRSPASIASRTNANAPPPYDSSSQAIAADDEAPGTLVSLSPAPLLTPPLAASAPEVSAAFPQPGRPRTRNQIAHREAPRAKALLHEPAVPDALNRTLPNLHDRSSANRVGDSHSAKPHTPAHSGRPRYQRRPTPFSTFTSSQ